LFLFERLHMANSVIGALRVNLGLDSAQFSSGARRAGDTLGRMRSQFTAVAGAAAALGAALIALTSSVARTAEEIGRFSQVANAMPQEFQRWAAAAATVGIEQEKLADILKDVNDRVGDFLSTGGGPMADFFENIAPQIGITADAFRELSGPQALQLYVDSLEQAGLSQQEMTFYLEAMASDVTALLPLLRNGGEEMNRLADNVESLGGVMSNETQATLTEYRSAMRDVGTALQGIGFRIADSVAPALTLLAEGFADSMREGGALRTLTDALIDNIDVLAASVTVAVTAFGVRYVGAMALAAVSSFSFAGALAVVRTALITTGIGALIVGAGYLVAQFGRLSTAAGGFGNAMTLLGDVVREVFGRLALGFQGVGELARAAAFLTASNWVEAAATIARPYQRLFNFLADGFNSIAELTGITVTAPTATFADSLQGVSDGLSGRGVSAAVRAGEAFREAAAPLESLQALRDVMAETALATEDAAIAGENLNAQLGNLGGGADTGGGGGGGGGGDQFTTRLQGLVDGLQTERETLDRWYEEEQAILADRRALEILGEEGHRQALLRLEEEYQTRLAAIRAESASGTLSDTATFFGALQDVTSAGGRGLARAAAIFGAIQATVNSYLAATQALAQPGLTLAGKFAAYAAVLATGLRGVAAIKQAGSKVGGGGGATSSSVGVSSALAEPADQEQRVIVDFGTSPDWYQDMAEGLLEQIYNASANGDRRVVVQRA
jgi:hypothetical protein